MKIYATAKFVSVISLFSIQATSAPAIVGDGDICYIALDLPDFGPVFFLGNKTQGVAAVSGNDTTPFAPGKITCQGQNDFGFERAYVEKAPCVVFGVPDFGDLFTEDGMVAITPSGKWSAQCMYRKDTSPQN